MKTNVNFGYNETQSQADTNNNGGRKSFEQTKQLKAMGRELFNKNLMQKTIAKMIGVTEKTVGVWAREWKQSKTIESETLSNLKNRLLALSIDKMTPIQDIVNLMLVIEQLENI